MWIFSCNSHPTTVRRKDGYIALNDALNHVFQYHDVTDYFEPYVNLFKVTHNGKVVKQ